MPIGARSLLGRLHDAFRLRAGIHPILPALVAGSFIMLFALDPFGVGSASHERSEQATLRIVSPWYEPSDRVVAVVIDDEYVRNRKAGWPFKYGEQGRILRALLAAGPAVLAVDLVYPHRHADTRKATQGEPGPPADSAAQLLAPIADFGETPVVFTAMALEPAQLPKDFEFCAKRFAAGEDRMLDPESIQAELLAGLRDRHFNEPQQRMRLAYVRWSGCEDRYPLMLGGNPASMTPAFAAFKAMCERQGNLSACTQASPSTRPEKYLQPMIVRSGAFPPAHQAFAYGPKTCQRFADERGHVPFMRQLLVSYQQLTLGMFMDLRKDAKLDIRLPCPAVTVVPMSTLEGATAEERRQLLNGKAVFLGANLTGVPDVIDSAVHGQIPGVVWHAMALDNLLSLGPGYLAKRHEVLQKILAITLIALFAYLLPFMAGLLEHSRWKATQAVASFAIWCILAFTYLITGHWWQALLALGIGIALDLTKPTSSAAYLVALLAAALGSVLFLSQGWLPGNWFGLVMGTIAFMHTIKPYYRGEDRKHFPNGSSLLGSLIKGIRP